MIQLHARVAATGRYVANRTVDVQVGSDARREIAGRIARIGQPCALGLRPVPGLTEDADVIQRSQLVVADSAVIMVSIQLSLGESQHEVGRAAVTGHALAAAGKTPGHGVRVAGGGVLQQEILLAAPFLDEVGIRGLLIPAIRVAGPLALLPQQDARLDTESRRGIARFALQR